VKTAYRIDELLGKTSEAHAVPKRRGSVVPMVVRIIRLQARTESSHNPSKPSQRSSLSRTPRFPTNQTPNAQRQQTDVQSKCPQKSEAGNPRAVAMERLLVNTYQWQAENQVISEEAIESQRHKNI